MKKLMFGLAIAAVGSAFAVESSNVVGYQELSTVSVGKKMICPTFLNVGESNKVSLADLKVSGYSAPVYDTKKKKWSGGCGAGKFVVETLTVNGTREAIYYWIDNGTIAAGWYADDAGTAIDGGASTVYLTSGKSLWIAGSDYKLVPAGSVNQFDIAYTTVSVGKVAVGNATPVNLTLGDLSVSGYTAPVYDAKKKKWSGGCGAGKFVVETLTVNGTRDAIYYWIDNGTIAAGWYADDAGTVIDGGASTVSIPAGMGLWISGSGYTLNIPAPEL